MRIVIIGAVAAGTSAAAKARRNNEDAEIVVYEKDSDISYSGCGMPYYLGGIVEEEGELTPRDPAYFKSRYNIDVLTRHEVRSIDPVGKTLTGIRLTDGSRFEDRFDKLVLATGASAVVPPIPGAEQENAFTLRTISDMRKIKRYIEQKKPRKAAVIGSGFIGLEMCENLKRAGLDLVLLERLPQITPGMDIDMAVYVRDHLEKNGVRVMTGVTVTSVTPQGVSLDSGESMEADLILLSVGVRPNVRLAQSAGIVLGATGAIQVDRKMRTNFQDIYACGDCAEQFSLITGKPIYRPLGSTANKTGRIAGDSLTGGPLEFRGILGTSIFMLFDMAVAQTGLSEREAVELGYDVAVCHNIKPSKPEYFGGKEMVIKGIADRSTGKLLGAQIVGYEGVDKRIDVFVTALSYGACAEDLFHLDLAYAPPFSTTKDPVMYTGMILENDIHRGRELITADKLMKIIESGQDYMLIDAREPKQFKKGHIETATSIPQSQLRKSAESIDKDKLIITYCNKGVTGNAAQNILLNLRFKKVYALSGGHRQFTKMKKDHNKAAE